MRRNVLCGTLVNKVFTDDGATCQTRKDGHYVMASRIWWDGAGRDSAAGGHVSEATGDSSAATAWFERQAQPGHG